MEETSKKVRHTPGSWRANALYSKVVTDEKEICEVSVNENNEAFSFEEWRANAQLIAAAPSLLEALERITEENYDDDDKSRHLRSIIDRMKDIAIEAIKLAKGEIKTELI